MRKSRFAVRVKPNAKINKVGGTWPGPSGNALIVTVTAPAIDGRANAAVERVLSHALGLPASTVRVVAGHRGRDKLVECDGDVSAILADLLGS